MDALLPLGGKAAGRPGKAAEVLAPMAEVLLGGGADALRGAARTLLPGRPFPARDFSLNPNQINKKHRQGEREVLLDSLTQSVLKGINQPSRTCLLPSTLS